MQTLADLHLAYAKCYSGSEEWSRKAGAVIAGGVTHDGRITSPFPLSYESAEGARKFDVDGNKIIDYWMGHGALILGHNPPDIARALIEQTACGTHFGGGHPREVRWAQQIVEMVPSAERVRFVASGTEATMMACLLYTSPSPRDS